MPHSIPFTAVIILALYAKNGIKEYSFLKLPNLSFVTGFIIPRHYYVNLSTVGIIADHFPNLQHVSFEQWRKFGDHHDEYHLLRKILQVQPPKLQSFSAFLDINVLAAYSLRAKLGESDVMSTQWLRIRSRQYTKINVSFFMDAKHFFDSSMWDLPEDLYWPNLEEFTMTSNLLNSDSSDSYVGMLQNAAKAALRMPKLRMLQIWFGYITELCVFRYTKHQGEHTIEWICTKSARRGPGKQVIKAWQSVANNAHGAPLHIKQTYLIVIKDKYFRSVHPVIDGCDRIDIQVYA
ncbi:hypothetical protein F4806DRAFT_505878 [Annulohypoxylon nitens]|nr:hypothetical protein F4806DRAFT_505878 [Annulohypoxylon nitens]